MAVGAGITTSLLPISGLSLGVACAGIKRAGEQDLVVMELCTGSTVAATFTKNHFCAAPVCIAKQHLQVSDGIRYLVINTGNANAGTGEQGMDDAVETCSRLAALKRVNSNQVLPFSTGVIGEYLPMDALVSGLPHAVDSLAENHWDDAAVGILTTDTRPKGISKQFEFDGEAITVTGISKGSGMIKPNMATMLAFVATDAGVPKALLEKINRECVEQSFNRITVDSDTSTNDACVLMATGQSKVSIQSDDDALYLHLFKTIQEVMLSLAQQIIRDGEGASKFIEVAVNGANTQDEALEVAYSVAHSPLVKTAMSASDANWGRILMAVGKCDLPELDVNKIDVHLGDVCIVKGGERAAEYTEEQGSGVVSQEEITISISLNRGEVAESVWTSDLSHEYVTINAEYRT